MARPVNVILHQFASTSLMLGLAGVCAFLYLYLFVYCILFNLVYFSGKKKPLYPLMIHYLGCFFFLPALIVARLA